MDLVETCHQGESPKPVSGPRNAKAVEVSAERGCRQMNQERHKPMPGQKLGRFRPQCREECPPTMRFAALWCLGGRTTDKTCRNFGGRSAEFERALQSEFSHQKFCPR